MVAHPGREDFESSCMAAEEQYTREVEELAARWGELQAQDAWRLEAENLEAMQREEQRLWEASGVHCRPS